jgi:glycosyltransferase involved in cell wall biosynthesis
MYSADLYSLRPKVWPKVSVVVASYNGSATLDACLESLNRLSYPEYEVILVDDGSTDSTPAIGRNHGVRCIRVEPNGGLSNARNVGLRAATGEIVAFIDDDAYADPDWLFFMISSLQAMGAVAVGGPNLSPPDEGFIAQCVDHAPGNPTHVLLGDELAEHVPGCNMAYSKAALEAIGGFDVTHRGAGDDVDVCWRFLVRDWKIAFSASAVVWHRRRASILKYKRQQRGYGFAEAHLQRAYPGRFNIFGGGVWRGRIYDDGVGWRKDFLPRVFKPRIYHGLFGSGLFQMIYQPALTPWFQTATSAEWQLVSWIATLSGLLSAWRGPSWAAYTFLAVGALLQAVTVLFVLAAGLYAQKQRRWKGLRAILGPLLVSYLHTAQPIARAWGRVQGWMHLREEPADFPAVERVWGNLGQRDRWLRHLCDHLNACGWVARPATEWDDYDLEILGPGPFRATFEAAAEENLVKSNHWVRFRIRAYAKTGAVIGSLVLLAALASLFLVPSLLLLALPLVYMLRVYLAGKRRLIQAISQCALESAAALNMPRVERIYQL